MKRILFILPVIICIHGCSAAPSPVLIGHIAPFGGADKKQGQSARQGIRLALMNAGKNKKQKVGAPVVVLHANAPATQVAFAAEAVRLTRINKTAVLFGGWTAGESTGLERGRVPVLSLSGVRGREKDPPVFLTGLTPQRKGRLLAKFAVAGLATAISPEALLAQIGAGLLMVGANSVAAPALIVAAIKPPRVVVFSDLGEKEYTEAAEAFVSEYRKVAGQPAHVTYTDHGELADRIKAAKRHNPDAMFLAGSAAAAEIVCGSFKGIPLLFAGSEGDREVLRVNRQTADNVYFVTAWIKDRKTKQNREFVKQHRKLFNQDPDVSAALAWDGMQLLLAALRECKSNFSPKQIQKRADELKNVPLLSGAASFGKDRILRRPAFLVRLQEGRIVLLERSDPK